METIKSHLSAAEKPPFGSFHLIKSYVAKLCWIEEQELATASSGGGAEKGGSVVVVVTSYYANLEAFKT